MILSASSNSAGFDRCEMSPVWIMKAGRAGSSFTCAIAPSSVPLAFGLGGLSKPMWLSLICRKVKPFTSCAMASSISPTAAGTPPETVQSTPVPAQVIHSSTLRRLGPSSCVAIDVSLRQVARKTGSAEAAFYSRRPFRRRGHMPYSQSNEIPRRSENLYPVRRGRERLRVVPAREVHRDRRTERRRWRQRRRRRRRGGQRPEHTDRLPLSAAFQGRARRQRNGQGPARRKRQGRGAQGAGRHTNLRRRRRDVAC